MNERPFAQAHPVRQPSKNPARDIASITPNDRNAPPRETAMMSGLSVISEAPGSIIFQNAHMIKRMEATNGAATT